MNDPEAPLPPRSNPLSNYPRQRIEGPLFLPDVDGKKEVVIGSIIAIVAPLLVLVAPVALAFPLGSIFFGVLANQRKNRWWWLPVALAFAAMALMLGIAVAQGIRLID